jgi:phosphoesterase RecJ-like protein
MSLELSPAGVLQREIEQAKRIVIGTHLNPDGDALGSALAMSHYLDGIHKDHALVCHHPAPRNLEFLPGIERVQQSAEGEFDLGIILDLDAYDRLGDTAPIFDRCPRTIVIDHHVPIQKPGDVRIIDTTAAATALILGRLFREMGAEFTPAISTCLLTGIVTDTGSFRYRNTSAEALSLSAFLLEHGGDINKVSEEIFQRKPLGGTRLLGHMLDTMRLAAENRIAYGVLTQADFADTGALDQDTEGFVNEMLFIDTVQIAALLREVSEGTIRCSIRSRNHLDVAAVARIFGGGGHKNAAGCTFYTSVPDAETQLVKELQRCLAFS